MQIYKEAVAYLESLVDFEKLGFRRHFADTVSLNTIRAMLAAAGDPQLHFPCVHIAGTKGKGSVAALVESVVRTAGYCTGLFTSPHLVSFRERIRTGGVMVSEAEIATLVGQVRPIIDTLRAAEKLNPSTFFEAYTLMAFLHFARQAVDLAVIETGLGGRLDATNTCRPAVCAITTLGMDHTEILGDTLPLIAREKAGILKPGVPAVHAPQPPEALAVLQDVAAAVGAPLCSAPPIIEVTQPPPLAVPSAGAAMPRALQEVTVGQARGALTVRLPLPGAHQAVNAAVALGIIDLLNNLGWDIPEKAVIAGMESTRWPGRLEIVDARPWIVLDVAHNPPAAAAVAGALPQLIEYERLFVIIGASAEKDIRGLCAPLAGLCHTAILTRAAISRSLPTHELQQQTADLWPACHIAEDVAEALQTARKLATTRDCILVTGSFYIVGEAMDVLGVAGDDA